MNILVQFGAKEFDKTRMSLEKRDKKKKTNTLWDISMTKQIQ